MSVCIKELEKIVKGEVLMNYEMMIPPFERVDFQDMNKKQAKEYFDWYLSQIDYRISLLLTAIQEDGIKDDFNYSVESLIPIWKWYEGKIYYRTLDEHEYQNLLRAYPDWMKPYISEQDLSWETLMYGMDVALYFAKVIIENNMGNVSWGYFTKPKNRDSVNQPVLLGFKNNMDLNPRLIVVNCTHRSGEEKLPTRLYDMYNVWKKFL